MGLSVGLSVRLGVRLGVGLSVGLVYPGHLYGGRRDGRHQRVGRSQLKQVGLEVGVGDPHTVLQCLNKCVACRAQ